MNDVTNEYLIKKAASVINEKKINESSNIGQVGAALVTDKDNIYTGVCIDAPSGMGFCAEAAAIAAMVTAGETKIKKIVATWKDGENIYVVAPCGRCRQFISFFDKNNINTEVILGKDKVITLRDLIPNYNEYNKI